MSGREDGCRGEFENDGALEARGAPEPAEGCRCTCT
jgi:hypothetical protein